MTALELQIHLLELQIELEESNYKFAVELQKDYNILFRMRENIKALKEHLNELIEGGNRVKYDTGNLT